MIEITRVKGKPVITALSVPADGGTRYRTVTFPEKQETFKVDAIVAHAMLDHKSGAFAPVPGSQAKSKRGLGMEITSEEDVLAVKRMISELPESERAAAIGKLNAAARNVLPDAALEAEAETTSNKKNNPPADSSVPQTTEGGK